MRSPKTRTWPSSGANTFISIRIDVVFPAPLGPSSPKIVPRGTARSRPATATNDPNRLITPSKRTAVSPGALVEDGMETGDTPPSLGEAGGGDNEGPCDGHERRG